jgi:hypothetical protein
MGQVRHGSATTTEAIRRALQRSQERLRTLARRHRINPKTVARWKKRSSVVDLPTGPKQPTSTVLSIEEEAIIVAFRRLPWFFDIWTGRKIPGKCCPGFWLAFRSDDHRRGWLAESSHLPRSTRPTHLPQNSFISPHRVRLSSKRFFGSPDSL